MAVHVIENRCPQNHSCPSVGICPFGALSQEEWNAPFVDKSKCTDCGQYILFCPMNAITRDV